MVDKFKNIENSTGKIYISLIMSNLMCIAELIMHDVHNMIFSKYYYLFFVLFLIIVYLLYRFQFGVNDKNYIKEMIEHHSMAILTSGEILKKTKDPMVKSLAENIVISQNKEIENMNKLLEELEKSKKK
jgi:hypothetical protein